MKRSVSFAIVGVLAATGAASASFIQYGVSAGATSTTLHAGNRELLSLGLSTSPTVFTGANLLNFSDGIFVSNSGTYAWNTPIPPTSHSGNPDRADASSPYAGGPAAFGTLAEVFGPSAASYNNLSYIIDGEDNSVWRMDLLFATGASLSADADDLSVEIAILERGRNSDFNLYGIFADNSVTAPVFVPRASLSHAGWTLNTLEIGDNQQVGGVGISLDSSWQDLVGFRIESKSSFNGPDIVAIATATPVQVPGPAGAALLTLGGLLTPRRPRR